jgi:hypothetical protein
MSDRGSYAAAAAGYHCNFAIQACSLSVHKADVLRDPKIWFLVSIDR